MKPFSLLALLSASATALHPHPTKRADTGTTPYTKLISDYRELTTSPASPPKNWAVALFPAFDSIDVFGPLDPLWYLAFSRQLNLALISETLDPVWVKPPFDSLNRQNSSFWYSVRHKLLLFPLPLRSQSICKRHVAVNSSQINPTHTYSSPPSSIDVLLVPGGAGVRHLNLSTQVEFVRRTYPNLKYLISVCTGAGVLAQAGVLDGKAATTNKKAWKEITPMGKEVDWKSPARWVVDGNIWTSSGVCKVVSL